MFWDKWLKCLNQFYFRRNFSFKTDTLYKRNVSTTWPVIMGIESTCDDTGVAVVDGHGKIIAEYLKSQTDLSVTVGGVHLSIASHLHEESLQPLINKCLLKAACENLHIDAVAVSVTPGLPPCLKVGVDAARKIASQLRLPLVQVHHMRAHALTARISNKYNLCFPYMVLLISGGHCLLAVVRNVDDFVLLGSSVDTSPGFCLDRAARKLRLKNLLSEEICGGRAIEICSQHGDPFRYKFPLVRTHHLDCNFSFSAFNNVLEKYISNAENEKDLLADGVISEVYDIAASLQYAITSALCHRVQRGLIFANMAGLLSFDNEVTLVASGGVASNKYVRDALSQVVSEYDGRLVCPPPELCTDNGVMVAWAGVELFKHDLSTLPADKVHLADFVSRSLIGEDWRHKIEEFRIKPKKLKSFAI